MKIITSLKSFAVKCKRVWSMLRKPTRKEFETTAKVAAIGIALLGFLGFLISIIMNLFVK